MKRNQKGASASAAATLIGIITLMFIFYILFLPAEERKTLLEESDFEVENYEPILLDGAPGLLSYSEKSVFDHSIPNVYLSEISNAVILASENPFVVKKSWFSEQKKSMVFSIPDLSQTENVFLNFQVTENSGTLLIFLNGRLIFEGFVAYQNPPPVLLPKALLMDTNQLDFVVAGSAFEKREYYFSDIKIVGDVLDVSKKTASNSFSLSFTESKNIEKAYLDFFAICSQNNVGTLTIDLNGKLVYSAVPACNSLNRQDLFSDELNAQKNTLTFRLDKGNVRAEQIRVRTVLEPVRSFVDYFDVKSSLYNDVLDKERQVILRIEFVDDSKLKRADLNVNGKKDSIDQRDSVFERDISSWIKEGNNYIEIKPLAELNIVKLEVKTD